MCKKGWRVTRVSVGVFCLTVPKNFVGESNNVSLVSDIEKNLFLRGLCYDILIFCRRVFVSQYRRTS